MLIPPSIGSHIVDVNTYTPLGSSIFNNWVAWILGTPAEVNNVKQGLS